MVWRRFLFWGWVSFGVDQGCVGEADRASVADLFEAVGALVILPVHEDAAERVIGAAGCWADAGGRR